MKPQAKNIPSKLDIFPDIGKPSFTLDDIRVNSPTNAPDDSVHCQLDRLLNYTTELCKSLENTQKVLGIQTSAEAGPPERPGIAGQLQSLFALTHCASRLAEQIARAIGG